MARQVFAQPPLALAVYLPEQYARLLALAADAADLEETWQEWHQNVEAARREMAAVGMHPVDVVVDLDELEAYCQLHGLANTSSTRAEYAAHLLSLQHSSQASHLRPQLVLRGRAGANKKKRRR